jgi:hypothetical protein
MSRINYILFLLVFIIQHSFAGILQNIEHINNNQLTAIIPENFETFKQRLPSIPPTNMMKLQTFLKETKTKMQIAIPLLLAGMTEIYLYERHHKSKTKIDNYNSTSNTMTYKSRQNPFENLTPYFFSDLILSSGFIFFNKTLCNYLITPATLFHDVLFTGLCINSLFNFSLNLLPHEYAAQLVVALSLIYGISNIKNRLFTTNNINNYQHALHTHELQKYIDEDYIKNLKMFLYIEDKVKLVTSSIEVFYKWMAQNHNGMNSKLDFLYTSSRDYLGDTNRLDENSKLTFTLIEQNNSIKDGLLAKILQKPGVKLIEITINYTDRQTVYDYVGVINDGESYYLTLALKLKNEITKSSKTDIQKICDSVFEDNNDCLEASTLVIQLDSIGKVNLLIKMFLLDYDCNYSVYDVTLNDHQLAHIE